MTTRPIVLVLLGAYWPGHEAAGANQSVRRLATALAAEFEFRIVARDRPFGATRPIAPTGQWIDRGYALVRYCAMPERLGTRALGAVLRETRHDLLMMNGFFDRDMTLPALILRACARVPRTPALLSPHGEFGAGALAIKRARKRAWIWCVRRFGLLADVWVHATGPREAEDVRAHCPAARGVLIASNVHELGAAPSQPSIGGGALRLAFLGRVTPVKNLDYALRILQLVSVPVEFHIYGPEQDVEYARACRAIAASLPRHVSVEWKGAIANDSVPATIAAYDALFLPTHGENFGYAILDALCAGVPALISDQTPFTGLEAAAAGWSLSLADPGAFVRAVERLAAMSAGERERMRVAARALAGRFLAETDAVAANRRMLQQALRGVAV